ncbi:MAG: maleylpyruvate isomerase family mycothiol-dependent enzyme [Acidimicrobiales bacterium]
MAQWNLAAKGRNDFADMVEPLTDEQWQQRSLCDAWTAHGVLAHLTSFVETGIFSFFGHMIKNRFDFDKVSVSMTDERSERSTADLIASLRAKATKSSPLPMFPERLTVSDTAIHTQDVRRPLGLPGSLDEEVLRTALDFVTTDKMATMLVNRRPIDEVRLQATDLDWSFGDGPEISGPAEAILMGLADRPVLDDLSGEGLARWR